jgi:nucleotide-binding universal stress UspA family protein
LSASTIGSHAEAAVPRARHDSVMAARVRRIVVGYDGSDASGRALDAAADLVGYGSTLTVVVCPPGSPDVRTSADQARAHLLRRQITARYLERPGEPAEVIATAARALDANLIVVGRTTRAPTSPESGSVSGAVLRQAPCDVLVVR